MSATTEQFFFKYFDLQLVESAYAESADSEGQLYLKVFQKLQPHILAMLLTSCLTLSKYHMLLARFHFS